MKNRTDNRIDRKFEELRQKGEKALITFVTSGDPDLETTEKLVLEMEQAGADLIELGVPFSDPIAEGPVIQSASQRALAGGATLVNIFDLVKRLREKTEVPLLLMLYVNNIIRFGQERFFRLCAESGVDGVIVPDLPFEEHEEIQEEMERYKVRYIHLIAPTSRERTEMIAKKAKGFLYCVSSTGVTGVRSHFETDFDAFFVPIKKHSAAPCAVGFGISSPQQAKTMQQYCDGVIVGSAIVRIVEEHGKEAVRPVGEFVTSLKKAMVEG